MTDSYTPIICGHRGAPVRTKENTPESFAAAAQDGATWVELDIRLSKELIPVVHHDPTVEGHVIADCTVAELADLGVSTFEQIIASLPDNLNVDVEIKSVLGEPGYNRGAMIEQRTYEVMQPHLAERQWIVTSFNPRVLTRMQDIAPDLPTGLLTDKMSGLLSAQLAQQLECQYVAPNYLSEGLDDPEVMAKIAEMGITVLVWTIDDVEVAAKLLKSGVTIFCTNDPRTMYHAVRAQGHDISALPGVTVEA